MKKIKTACSILFVFLFVFLIPATAFATSSLPDDTKYVYSERGYKMQIGGVNSLDRQRRETDEELKELEGELRQCGYICVSGEGRDISDSEYRIFCQGENSCVPYSGKLESIGSFNKEYCKIYVYKPIYDDAMKQLKNGGMLYTATRSDLFTSTVLVDYGINYVNSKVGKVVNEYNDNIPENIIDIGYLKIYSPVSTVVLLESFSRHSYDEIPVIGGEAVLIKIPQDGYFVKELSSVEISKTEKTLPYRNKIVITEEHTRDNPYYLDLTQTIQECEIPAAEGITAIDTPNDDPRIGDGELSEEIATAVGDDKQDKQEDSSSWLSKEITELIEKQGAVKATIIISLIILAILALIVLLVFLIKRLLIDRR